MHDKLLLPPIRTGRCPKEEDIGMRCSGRVNAVCLGNIGTEAGKNKRVASRRPLVIL